MSVKFTDLVKDIAELDVATAQAYTMVEAQLGIKIDSITDFILKFIYTEKLNNRDVTITILANTLMINENTIRKKLKTLIDNQFVEVCECGCDRRLKKLVPTPLCNRLMHIFVACKLKTACDISPMFKLMFESKLNKFYKEYDLVECESFKKNTQFINYKDKFLNTKNIYKKYPNKIRLIY